MLNRYFSTKLNVMPKGASGSNYGIIMGQNIMRRLEINTSVRNNTISWGDKIETKIVPRKFWTSNASRKYVSYSPGRRDKSE